MVVRALRAVLALLVVALGLVLVGATAAAACTCRPLTFEKQVQRADVVFLATVDSVTAQNPGHTYDLTASRTYRRPVEHSTQVQSLAGPGACGLGELEVGEDYLFLARGTMAPYDADSCGGTTTATPERVTKVESLLGDGRVVTAPPPPPPVMERLEDAPPLGFARMAAPGVAAVLLGALGLVVVRRLARR